MKRFERIVKKLGLLGAYRFNLTDEKGFINGKFIGTKWGITAPMLAMYLGRTPKAEEMKNLTYLEAMKLLYQHLWLGRGLTNLYNNSVAMLIYNGMFNLGTNEMRLIIKQAVVELEEYIEYYYVFTPHGIELLNSLDQAKLYAAIHSKVKKHLKKIKNRGKRRRLLKQFDINKFVLVQVKPTNLSLQNRISKGVLKSLNKLKLKAS